jgi:hypothetical protein
VLLSLRLGGFSVVAQIPCLKVVEAPIDQPGDEQGQRDRYRDSSPEQRSVEPVSGVHSVDAADDVFRHQR